MRLTVERIVGDVVLLEKEDMSHDKVELELLPQGVREGSILLFDGSKYSFDTKAEAETRARILAKQKSAFSKR